MADFPVAENSSWFGKGALEPNRIVLVCFFLSGMTGLMYEIVWTRWLVLIFGSTTFAVSTVLTTFMAGLAIGSFLFGRAMVRWGRPLFVYAVLEGVIGVYALVLPLFLPLLEPIYRIIWEWFHPQFYVFSIIRFLLVGIALIIPTTLMGATLPVLSLFMKHWGKGTGFTLGFLYFLNTAGAILGCFAGGFIFLPLMGLYKTTLLAVTVNLLIFGVIFLLEKATGTQVQPGSSQGAVMKDSFPQPVATPVSVSSRIPPFEDVQGSGPDRWESVPKWGMGFILFSFGLSGFVALVYEVVWSRALTLVLGSSVYAFSAMLTTFLSGLALGSYCSALFVEKLRARILSLAFIQLAVALTAYVTLLSLGNLPFWMASIYGFFSGGARESGVFLFPLIQFLLCFGIMFVPTFLLGMVFPIVTKIYQFRTEGISRVAGDTYATNTVGAILGAFSGGFILIPLLGIQETLLWMIGLNVLCGLLLFWISPHKNMKISAAAASCLFPLVLGVLIFPPQWNEKIMSSGISWNLPFYSAQSSSRNQTQFYGLLENQGDLLYYREGITATVTVEKSSKAGVSLKVNGRRESGSLFMKTQVLISHIPLMFADHPEKLLVIGFGSGATIGSSTLHPVKEIKTVELEQAIIEAAKFFDQENNRPLQDSRVEVILNDGRNYLLAQSENFDVIISQPSIPWVPGASNLFTREFFELSARKLTDGGIFGQWFSADMVGQREFLSVFRSFQEVFPYVKVFETTPGDILWVGSEQPLSFDIQRVEALFSNEAIAEDLERIGVETPSDLLSHYLGGTQETVGFLESGRLNTDDNNYVEFFGPYYFYGKKGVPHRIVQSLFPEPSSDMIDEMIRLAGQFGVEADTFLRDLASSSLSQMRFPFAVSYVDEALARNDRDEGHLLKADILKRYLSFENNPSAREKIKQMVAEEYEAVVNDRLTSLEAVLKIAQGYEQIGNPDRAEEMYQKALEINPRSPLVQTRVGAFYASLNRGKEAEAAFKTAIELDPDRVRPNLGLGLLYRETEKWAQSETYLLKALRLSPEHPDVLFELASIYTDQGRFVESIQVYRRLLALNPDHSVAHNNLGNLYQDLGELNSAIQEYREAIRIKPDFFEVYLNLGVIFQRIGETEKAYEAYQTALRLNPIDPTLHYNMAFLFEARGEPGRAADSFRRFINLVQNTGKYENQLRLAEKKVESLTAGR